MYYIYIYIYIYIISRYNTSILIFNIYFNNTNNNNNNNNSILYIYPPYTLHPTLPPPPTHPQYGTFVYPTTMAVRRAMDGIEFDESYNPRPSGDEMPGSYPIFSYTFIIVRMSTMPDCERAVELYGYIRWFMSNEEARSVGSRAGSSGVTRRILERAREDISRVVILHGTAWATATSHISGITLKSFKMT